MEEMVKIRVGFIVAVTVREVFIANFVVEIPELSWVIAFLTIASTITPVMVVDAIHEMIIVDIITVVVHYIIGQVMAQLDKTIVVPQDNVSERS